MDSDLKASERPANDESQRLRGFFEELVGKGSERKPRDPEAASRLAARIAGTCPKPGDWVDFAIGNSQSEKNDCLRHAALCSACLAQLRRGQAILNRDGSEEEVAELLGLASVSPQWQHRMAVELARTPGGKSGGRSSLLRTLMIGLGTAILLVLAVTFSPWTRRQSAEQLLARAYSEDRVIELRMPGASYAAFDPTRRVRGMSPHHEDSALLSADREIEKKLKEDASDRNLLELKARAAILGEQYDEAVAILDKLVAAGPPTQDLLLDAGSAHFLRGTALGDDADRSEALELLGKAARLAPANSVILFNEAIVLEDRGHLMDAETTWKQYLGCETDPGWTAEGLRRLQTLRARIHE
jgi:tetratricopeptide (TPR) repeat protein